jgi:hypothetical protein
VSESAVTQFAAANLALFESDGKLAKVALN